MPKLREALKQTSGVDVGGNEFTLTETDIQPYIDNPEMAQMEADVTQARYGGTTIQDYAAAQDVEPVGPWGADAKGGKGGPIDFSRRADFEKSVFKQLKSETMPDGNPFNFNPTASLNAISKQDLPELFRTVFQNEVTWQDRHLLDDEQKKYWMSEVKRYRAHLSSALGAERESAISAYNQMMNQFDNTAKEIEAQRKRERQKRQDLQTAKIKQAESEDKKQKSYQENLKRRTELFQQEAELISMVMEAEANQTLTAEESAAHVQNLQSIRDERKAIEAILEKPAKEWKKKASKVIGPELTGTHEKGEKSPTMVKGKESKGGKRVVKTGTVRSGPNKGRTKIMYEDGSFAYADETK